MERRFSNTRKKDKKSTNIESEVHKKDNLGCLGSIVDKEWDIKDNVRTRLSANLLKLG